MSQNKEGAYLTGVDSRGNTVPLVAAISQPDKDSIIVKWRKGYDAAVFRLGDDTIVALGDGVETFTLKIALQPGEYVISTEHDADAREIKVVTRGR